MPGMIMKAWCSVHQSKGQKSNTDYHPFFQVIKARFGKRTHLVFCCFAFFTNLIVMMSLTIAGTAVLNSLVKDLSPELAAMLLVGNQSK